MLVMIYYSVRFCWHDGYFVQISFYAQERALAWSYTIWYTIYTWLCCDRVAWLGPTLTFSVSDVILSLSVVLQTCNASVSRSSDHGTHISDSGPYPSHHSSLPLSVMMGPGRSSLREGKCVSSFSICGLRWETWNVVCFLAIGSM
jgi:hypothetical protein